MVARVIAHGACGADDHLRVRRQTVIGQVDSVGHGVIVIRHAKRAAAGTGGEVAIKRDLRNRQSGRQGVQHVQFVNRDVERGGRHADGIGDRRAYDGGGNADNLLYSRSRSDYRGRRARCRIIMAALGRIGAGLGEILLHARRVGQDQPAAQARVGLHIVVDNESARRAGDRGGDILRIAEGPQDNAVGARGIGRGHRNLDTVYRGSASELRHPQTVGQRVLYLCVVGGAGPRVGNGYTVGYGRALTYHVRLARAQGLTQ